MYRKYFFHSSFFAGREGNIPCHSANSIMRAFKRYTNTVEFLASQHQKPFRCFWSLFFFTCLASEIIHLRTPRRCCHEMCRIYVIRCQNEISEWCNEDSSASSRSFLENISYLFSETGRNVMHAWNSEWF